VTWLIKHAVGTGGTSRALRRSGFGGGGPAAIASLVAALAEPPAYRPVATDGAARAAALMAERL
jgi:hypothetical protein